VYPGLIFQNWRKATLPGDPKHAAASGLLYTLFDYPHYKSSKPNDEDYTDEEDVLFAVTGGTAQKN
jgi:hypothetical protein